MGDRWLSVRPGVSLHVVERRQLPQMTQQSGRGLCAFLKSPRYLSVYVVLTLWTVSQWTTWTPVSTWPIPPLNFSHLDRLSLYGEFVFVMKVMILRAEGLIDIITWRVLLPRDRAYISTPRTVDNSPIPTEVLMISQRTAVEASDTTASISKLWKVRQTIITSFHFRRGL